MPIGQAGEYMGSSGGYSTAFGPRSSGDVYLGPSKKYGKSKRKDLGPQSIAEEAKDNKPSPSAKSSRTADEINRSRFSYRGNLAGVPSSEVRSLSEQEAYGGFTTGYLYKQTPYSNPYTSVSSSSGGPVTEEVQRFAYSGGPGGYATTILGEKIFNKSIRRTTRDVQFTQGEARSRAITSTKETGLTGPAANTYFQQSYSSNIKELTGNDILSQAKFKGKEFISSPENRAIIGGVVYGGARAAVSKGYEAIKPKITESEVVVSSISTSERMPLAEYDIGGTGIRVSQETPSQSGAFTGKFVEQGEIFTKFKGPAGRVQERIYNKFPSIPKYESQQFISVGEGSALIDVSESSFKGVSTSSGTLKYRGGGQSEFQSSSISSGVSRDNTFFQDVKTGTKINQKEFLSEFSESGTKVFDNPKSSTYKTSSGGAITTGGYTPLEGTGYSIFKKSGEAVIEGGDDFFSTFTKGVSKQRESPLPLNFGLKGTTKEVVLSARPSSTPKINTPSGKPLSSFNVQRDLGRPLVVSGPSRSSSTEIVTDIGFDKSGISSLGKSLGKETNQMKGVNFGKQSQDLLPKVTQDTIQVPKVIEKPEVVGEVSSLFGGGGRDFFSEPAGGRIPIIPLPIIPFSPGGGFFNFEGLGRGRGKQVKSYTPSLAAVTLDIRGPRQSFGELTGLGILPIPIRKGKKRKKKR